jgi:hypothetical protein
MNHLTTYRTQGWPAATPMRRPPSPPVPRRRDGATVDPTLAKLLVDTWDEPSPPARQLPSVRPPARVPVRQRIAETLRRLAARVAPPPTATSCEST